MNAITRRLATLATTLALAATAAGCANTPTATPTTMQATRHKPNNPYQANDRASNAATWSTAKSRADP